MSEDSPSDRRESRRDLYVVFEIDPAPESGCPLGGFGSDIQGIRQQLLGEECHTDTTVRADDCACGSERDCTEVVHVTSDVDPSCPCTVFGEFDCVPELVDIVDGRMQVETYLPDREHLVDLVAALEDVADGLRLRKLKRIDTGTAERHEDTATLDLFEVTDKQREAATKAVAAGYYASPQETTLGELAEDFDISKSALSQRLTAVESKLATAAFAGADD